MLPTQFVSRPALVRSRLPRDVEATIRQWHQYGAFLMTAVVGWVDSECQLVYNVFAGLSWAHRFTVRVLGARPGHLRREEMALRQFIRCLFLSEVKNEESCAWLFRILQPWPLVFRAKLIYIIYGPMCHYEILWTLPSLPHTALMSQLLRTSLAHIAGVLTCLHEDAAGWNSDDTITVLEELFVLSREWLPVNRAMLLAHCGLDICVQMLASKIINGRKAEVASIFFNLILRTTPTVRRRSSDSKRSCDDGLVGDGGHVCPFWLTAREIVGGEERASHAFPGMGDGSPFSAPDHYPSIMSGLSLTKRLWNVTHRYYTASCHVPAPPLHTRTLKPARARKRRADATAGGNFFLHSSVASC
ncbi:hypothetical protein MRX96_046105 [Rhipicephalus microplus]